jgi:hypothetical protein
MSQTGKSGLEEKYWYNMYTIASGHLCSVQALGLVCITQCSPSICSYIS